MERKITITGLQKFTPKETGRSPMYKLHYTYEDEKITGFGCDNVLVPENFVKRYNPQVGSDYLAAVYFDNDYRTHFAAMFVEG